VAGHDVLLLDAVSGTTQKALLDPPPALRHFCHSLVGTTSYDLAAHPWVQAHQNLSDGSVRFLEALAGRLWPVAIQHGDLAPWNLIHHPRRCLTAIDWEYGLVSGFPGLDLAQYVLQVAALVKRLRPDDARAHAIRHLLADDGLALNGKEAAALVGLAARMAYRNVALAGHSPTSWAQAWRRAVWEGGVDA
jgi:aminoglycoside phosphotransferase (APT) family kinase protein